MKILSLECRFMKVRSVKGREDFDGVGDVGFVVIEVMLVVVLFLFS